MEHSNKCLAIKPILFPQDPAFKGDLYRQYPSSEQVQAFLLRYFPKYMNDLGFNLPKGHFSTRLKHIKLIRNLSLDDRKDPHSNYWRLLATNKAKTIHNFINTSNGRYSIIFSKRTLQKLKLFPAKKELSLNPPDHYSPSSELHYFERSCSYLGMLNNLKLLELFICEERNLPILTKVNRNERVLSHLKIFSLVFTWASSQEHQFFQALLNYKTVLKYLIYLDLGTLSRHEFFQVLQMLPSLCNQLNGLAFSTSPKEFNALEFEENTCLEDDNYLECLEAFKTLKRLHIISCHSLTFLQNAKLPSSLQSLHLEFQHFNWETFDTSHKNMAPFHQNLKKLTDLKTLDFSFSRPSDNNEPHPNEKYLLGKKSFIEGLLKNISRLTRLNITFSRRAYLQTHSTGDPIHFDFSHFLMSISHLSDSLEIIDIEDGSFFFKFITQENLPCFSKLSSLSISGEISILNLESVLGLASSKIQLDQIVVESFKELLHVFLLVAKVKEIEKKQVNIKIDVESFKKDEADEAYLKENYEEVKKEIQGVNLESVNLEISANGKIMFFRKEIKSFEGLFGQIDFESPYYCY